MKGYKNLQMLETIILSWKVQMW